MKPEKTILLGQGGTIGAFDSLAFHHEKGPEKKFEKRNVSKGFEGRNER